MADGFKFLPEVDRVCRWGAVSKSICHTSTRCTRIPRKKKLLRRRFHSDGAVHSADAGTIREKPARRAERVT